VLLLCAFMVYEVESVRPRDGPKKTWKEVVAKIGRSNNYARQMIWTVWNGESQLRMLYKGRVWVNEWIFFLVPVHMNHPGKGPLTCHYLFIFFSAGTGLCSYRVRGVDGIFRAFNCRISYGLFLPTVILTVIWYSITHSLFLSRLKTFLLHKSFPL